MNDISALARIDSFPYQHRLREVMSTPVLTAEATQSLGDSIRRMYEARVSSIVVIDGEGRTAGIFTESDLLRILSTTGPAGLDTNLGAVMASPVVTVHAEACVYVALGKMTRQGFRHLVVVDDANRPIGMITGRGLLKVRASDALAMEDWVEEATGPEDMKQAMAALPILARSLLAEGVSARNIAAVVAMTVRGLTARAAELAEKSMQAESWGPAPVSYAVLVLGSGGRGESLLVFDQDNAIVHAGTEADDPWFAELGQRINTMLNAAGIPFCDGGVMARERKWRKSLTEWESEVHDWVFSLENQTVMNCDIFFDFQPVWGDRDLADELRAYAINKASQSAFFLQYLTQNVASMESATGLFGRFNTKQGRLNLKKFALLPLISAARLRAIRAHITATATDERFGALRDLGQMHEDDCRDFADIREIIMRLMLDQQLADLAADIPPSARLDPRRLDTRSRTRLRWAFDRLKSLKVVCAAGR